MAVYTKDTNGFDVYDKDSDGNETYGATTDTNKIFADTSEGKRYARKAETGEYYPRINDVDVVLVDGSNKYIYAETDGGKRQIYPKDANDNEFVPPSASYAKVDGAEIYPKSSNGDEFYHNDLIAKDGEGNPKYPVVTVQLAGGTSIKKSKYPSDATGELYQVKVKHAAVGYTPVVFSTDEDENEYYAKNINHKEFYPASGQFALDARLGEHKWAYDATGVAVFPLDSNLEECYVKSIDGESDVTTLGGGKILARYAELTAGGEIYPKKKTKHGLKQVTLNDKYALDANGLAFYPVDEFGNEYVLPQLKTKDAVYPIGYPVTWDDFVIVTADGSKKPLLFDDVLPKISSASLTKRLYRSWNDYTDFLSTEKHTTRKGRGNGKAYKTRGVGWFSAWNVLAAAIAAVAVGMLLWMFNVKFFARSK